MVSAPNEEIIDTHTHVVSGDHERYPLNPRVLSPSQWYLDSPADAEKLRGAMDDSGVSRAILVQGVGAYTYENQYAMDAAQETPDRFISACCIDTEASDALPALDRWVSEGGAAGSASSPSRAKRLHGCPKNARFPFGIALRSSASMSS